MAPQTAKSLMKEFRASFRRKKSVDPAPKANAAKEAEEEELAKLFELKENVGDELPLFYTDLDLLGFLRARSLNVKEAEKLLKLDECIHRILRTGEFEPTEEMLKYRFSGVVGFDKEGSLVRVINAGGADAKGLMNMISTIDGLKILIWMVNKDRLYQEEENKKNGKKSKQFVYILNLQDLSMSQISYKPAFDTAMQALKLLQDHYHDALKTVYFINAPSFFSSIFKLFKPVIKDSLQQKIRIFDHDNGMEELLKQIDADVLPQYLGGNRVDSNGDPNCSEFISFGAVVPDSNYASNFLNPEDPEVVVATVPAGATLNFRFPVRQVGSVIEWHIQGKDNDIGIGLFKEPFPSGTETPRTRKKKEEDMSKFDQLTPVIRSQCHVCPEEGSSVLWFTGNIILHFDNTYSWMNSKEVFFKVAIRPPTDAERNLINTTDRVTKGISQMALTRKQ